MLATKRRSSNLYTVAKTLDLISIAFNTQRKKVKYRPYLLSRKIDLHVLYSCNNVKHAFTRPHNGRVALRQRK